MAAGWPTKANYATGDVLSATNMNDLSGTVNLINPTAKGDLYAGSAVNTYTKLAVGANATVLTADSTTATGLKWAAASSGALTLVKAATTFTSVADTGTTFDSVFSSTYKYYAVFVQEFGAATITDDFQMQLMYSGSTQTSGYNGSSMTAVYNSTTLTNITNASTAQFTITNSCGTYSNSTRNAGVINFSSVGVNNNGANFWGSMYNGYNEESNVFVGKLNASQTWTGFKLKSSSSNISGVVSVYGYGN